MATVVKSAPAKKTSSVTTEVVIGQAAASLSKATVDLRSHLNTALASVNGLEERSAELQLEVANKEARLAEIDVEIAEKERTATLDLELKLKANKLAIVTSILSENGKFAVDVTEYRKLEADLIAAQADVEKQINAESGKAKAMAEAKAASEKKLYEAEFNAKQAENIAKIAQLTEKVTYLAEQSAKWEKALADEREASIKRAQASSIGAINVGSTEANRR